MNRFARIAAVCGTLVLLSATPALGQDGPAAPSPGGFSLLYTGTEFAAGMIIIGAAYGIGRISSCAVENMARQPEVAGNIQTAMIISAALIEGATFFGLIVLIMTQ